MDYEPAEGRSPVVTGQRYETLAEYEHKAAMRRLLVRAGQVLFLAVVVLPVAMWCASLG